MSTAILREPRAGSALRYRGASLPLTWPDRSAWKLFFSLLRAPFVKSGTVDVPPSLPGPTVPEYARRPFHGLPNGYYSHHVAAGYDTGFEISMLGRIARARQRMVEALTAEVSKVQPENAPEPAALSRPVERVLDVGCGSGRLSQMLLQAGVEEVWGLDPSPYLLQIAQKRTPDARFVQAVVEDTPFSDESFDAVGACFLFHEPPRAAAAAGLRELHRVLRPGGRLVIVDPCRDHIGPPSVLRLAWKKGLHVLYFHLLARSVFEPYLQDWHSLDHAAWFAEQGFDLERDNVDIPLEFFVARKRA